MGINYKAEYGIGIKIKNCEYDEDKYDYLTEYIEDILSDTNEYR